MLIIRSLLLLCIFSIPTTVFALRCGSDLILKGDRKFEVLRHCGEPTLIEQWEEETVTYVTDYGKSITGDLILNRRSGVGHSHIVLVEEWTYNFGSNRFLQYLTFINGKLKKIEDGPRGFYGDILSGHSKSRCGSLVERGDRKVEVIRKCGDPYTIEYGWEEHISAVSTSIRTRRIPRYFMGPKNKYEKDFILIRERVHSQSRSVVNIEEWVYNFGPTQFLYFITIHNGKVIRIETGDYGF